MKNRGLFVALLSQVFLGAAALSASESLASVAAPAIAPWLQLPSGARSLGLAGAGSSLYGGTDAMGANPARLAGTRNSEITLAHQVVTEGVASERAGFVTSLGSGGLGMSLDYLSMESVENISLDSAGNVKEGPALQPKGYAVALGYGQRWRDLSLGVGARVLGDDPDGQGMATGASADVGLTWAVASGLNTGASLNQAGPNLLDTALPTQARMGLSYERPIGDEGMSLLLALEERIPTGNSALSSTHVGLQTALGQHLALRGGYEHFADLGTGQWRAGLGAGLAGYRIDYAYAAGDVAGGSHLISLTMDWQQTFGRAQAATRTSIESLAALP